MWHYIYSLYDEYIYIFFTSEYHVLFRVHACSCMLYWINYHTYLVYVPCLSNYNILRSRSCLRAGSCTIRFILLYIWWLYKSKSKLIVCLKHALRKKRTCAHLLLESFWNDHRVSENSVDDTKEVITWETGVVNIAEYINDKTLLGFF